MARLEGGRRVGEFPRGLAGGPRLLGPQHSCQVSPKEPRPLLDEGDAQVRGRHWNQEAASSGSPPSPRTSPPVRPQTSPLLSASPLRAATSLREKELGCKN